MKMDFNKLNSLNCTELKKIAQELDIPYRRDKNQMIQDITTCFQEYESYKQDKIDKYTKIKQLGWTGKEGTTYLVQNKAGEYYAMKTFRKQKSSATLQREAQLQKLVANLDAAPQVIDIDTVSKYLVMDKMDRHLLEVISKQNNTLSKSYQKQIIVIYKKMDHAGVFHGDANLLNYMIKGKKLYIIDFGMAKEITSSLVNKLGTSTPNINIMTLGLILKLREMNCSMDSYNYLLQFLTNEQKNQFNLN